MSMVFKSDGIYADDRTGNLYHRPVIAGVRTWRKLTATTLTMARKEKAALKTRQLEAKIGVAIDPYAELSTIGEIAAEYLRRDCPDRKGRARVKDHLKPEIDRVQRLLLFWSDRNPREITAEDCRDYHAWRRKRNNKSVKLDVSVDRELTTLSNILNWAVQNPRKTGLVKNPLQGIKPRFCDRNETRHCTAVMPMGDDVLHQLARHLLATDRSRPLGWQLLLEALTGARTSEILACRIDSTEPRQPGYQDDAAIHLNRRKKGIEPWALLEAIPGHAPLRQCLKAFRNWHASRYQDKNPSPWFIPGRNPQQPMTRLALTNALERACLELGLPKITSHGLRAYFVRTLRSLGIDDSEIAKRLGHRSGVVLVEQTYGLCEPGWFNSRRQNFIPDKGDPAWKPWLKQRASKKIVPMPVYHPYTTIRKTRANGAKLSILRKPVRMPENIVQTAFSVKTSRL